MLISWHLGLKKIQGVPRTVYLILFSTLPHPITSHCKWTKNRASTLPACSGIYVAYYCTSIAPPIHIIKDEYVHEITELVKFSNFFWLVHRCCQSQIPCRVVSSIGESASSFFKFFIVSWGSLFLRHKTIQGRPLFPCHRTRTSRESSMQPTPSTIA